MEIEVLAIYIQGGGAQKMPTFFRGVKGFTLS